MPRKKAIDEPIPLQIVKQMSDAFPGCYDEVEKMRRDKGKGLPDWDDRCYIPINGTLAIMDYFRDKNPNPDCFPGLLEATAGWRQFKPIYKFDKDLFELLTSETDDTDMIIPTKILNNLPYQTIYIDVEDAEEEFLGYFVYWDYDVNFDNIELRFTTCDRTGDFDTNIMITKPGWTIEDSIKALVRSSIKSYYDEEINKNLKSWGLDRQKSEISKFNNSDFLSQYQKEIIKFLQPVLYICAINADINENPEQKKIHRAPAPKAPIKDAFREIEKWDVGVRVGSQIRKHRMSESTQSRSSGTHRSPRPHTRRAHWAHYWTGPRKPDDSGNKPEQTLILKWIPPTYVNFGGDDGELPAVEHKVK